VTSTDAGKTEIRKHCDSGLYRADLIVIQPEAEGITGQAAAADQGSPFAPPRGRTTPRVGRWRSAFGAVLS
jgi:hypothetical protein